MTKDIFDIFDDMRLSWDIKNRCLEPLVFIEENDKDFIVTADLPCVKKEDVSVYAAENTLEIKARMGIAYKFHRWGTIQKGIEFSSFRKVIGLSKNIIPKNAEAKFNNGVLEVRLPKRVDKKKSEVKKLCLKK